MPAKPMASADETVDLRVYLSLIRAHWWLIVLFALVGAATAFTISSRQCPIYASDGEIVLIRETPIAGIRQDLAVYSPWDETFVHTHTRLIGSEKLVAAAAARLTEMTHPPAAQPKLPDDAVAVESGAYGLTLTPEQRTELAHWIEGKSSAALAGEIQGGLTPGFIKKSRILSVQVRSPNPVFAAAAVRALADSYAEAVSAMSSTSSERLFLHLQAEREAAERRLQQAAEALLDFKRTAEVDVLTGTGLHEADADPRTISLIRGQLALKDKDGMVLIGELAALEHEIAVASRRYGEKHPDMRTLVEKRDALTARLEATGARLYRQWQLQHAGDRNKVQQDILERKLESGRQLHDLILLKMKEVDLSTRTSELSLLTLKYPAVSDRPISPRKTRDTGMGGVAGLCAGLLLAMVREYARRQLVSRDTVVMDATIKVIGQMPLLRSGALTDLLGGQTTGVGAEAIRALRTAVSSLMQETGGHVIQITSPGAGDGKSTLAAALGRSFAMAGKRTLLLDLDMRRGQLQRLFGIRTDHGLADMLNGEDAGAPTEIDANLWVYGSGKRLAHSAEMIASERFVELMAVWNDRYDVVLMDSPPLLAVTDSALLAPHAQVRLLVARSRHTHRTACVDAAAMIDSLGHPLHGILLNGFRPGEGSGYTYGYYYGYGTYHAR